VSICVIPIGGSPDIPLEYIREYSSHMNWWELERFYMDGDSVVRFFDIQISIMCGPPEFKIYYMDLVCRDTDCKIAYRVRLTEYETDEFKICVHCMTKISLENVCQEVKHLTHCKAMPTPKEGDCLCEFFCPYELL